MSVSSSSETPPAPSELSSAPAELSSASSTSSAPTPVHSPSHGAGANIAPQNPFENQDTSSTMRDIQHTRSDTTMRSEESTTAPNSPQDDSRVPETHKNNSNPSTPVRKGSRAVPQSAPATMASAPAALQASTPHPAHPASERRMPSEFPNYSRPTQPVFDDDENTEPSSAATGNTSDFTGGTSDAPKPKKSTISKILEFTKRQIGSNANKDDSEDEGNVEDGTVISGYLQKLGRNGKWQTRWFETDGECLSYYKSRKRSKLLATLDLEKVGDIFINENDPKGCSFNIQVLGRLYYLRAENRAACRDWVISLNRVKEARLHQGNVKLLDPSRPVDLLDGNQDTNTPRVVVVANRERTRAVNKAQDWERLMVPNQDNPEDGDGQPHHETKRISTIGTVVLGRWSKRKTSLTRLRAKLAHWARSVRKFGCMNADSAVHLDRHVHPPGHDYQSSRQQETTSDENLNADSDSKDLIPAKKGVGLQRGVSSASDDSARYLS